MCALAIGVGQLANDMVCTELGRGSVSYTHLDVYKRQAQQTGPKNGCTTQQRQGQDEADVKGHGEWAQLPAIDFFRMASTVFRSSIGT